VVVSAFSIWNHLGIKSAMAIRLLQLAKESAVYGLSAVLARFAAIFLVPVYTRIFTPEDYGVLAMVTTIMVLLGVFIGLGAEASFTVSYYDTDDEARRADLVLNYVLIQLVTGVLFGGLLFVVAQSVATFFLGSPERAIYVQLAAATLVAGSLSPVAFNLFRIARRPWTLVVLNSSASLAQIGLSIVLVALLGYGLIGNFLAQLVVAACFLVISAWLLRSWLRNGAFSYERMLHMLRLGLPYVVSALAAQVILVADRFFIEYYRSLWEVGLYAIGASIASALALITSAFQMALGPYAMSIQHQPDARITYASILTTFCVVAGGCATLLSLFAPEVLLLFTTASYLEASVVVPYLAFYTVAVSIGYIASLGSWLAKRTEHLAWTTLVGVAVNIALNIVLVPSYGIAGAAIATLAAQVTFVTLLFWASQRCYSIPYRWRDMLWTAIISALIVRLGQMVPVETPFLTLMLLKLLLACLFPVGLLMVRVIEPAAARRAVGRLVVRSGSS
jgi:O-antigen/teichoic acid export membrane protein